ncbi:MAG: leucine-rich repeat protein, partial [Candidatus Neoclostridium sp.]
MKRKLLITFTACLLASFACFAACGGGEEHEHAYKESAVEPTCTQPGYVVYLCDCGDQYKEITSDPTGHDYGEPIWDWTGFESATATFVCAHDSAHVQTVNASVDVDNSVPPTCSESGVNSLVATAEFDGRVFTDYANETVAALNHTLSLIGANAATCEEEGNVEYRQCSACGKLFSDEAAANEIDFASTRLAPLGHDYVQPEWDCDWEEKEGYLTVSCKNDASHGKTVPAEINERVIRPVTCEQDGEAEYVAKATVDGEEFTLSHSVSLPHYGHNYSETDWAWTGYDKAKLILSCQNDNSHKIEITAAVTSSIFSSPTCTSTGEKIYIATAEYNGKTYSVQKTEILPRTEHDYTLYLWHWNDEKEATAEFSCNQCDYRQSVTAAITKKITLSPTCIKTGTAEYTATATLYGKTFTDVKTEAEQKISHNFTSGACPICGQPAPTEGLIYKTENGITVCAGISDSVTATEISIAPTYEGMPVKGVGSRAFAYNNKNIVSVYIPDSVETIGSQAFSGCSSLRRVTISNDALTVQSNAFENCSLLDSLYITNLKAWCGSSFSDYTANPLYTASNLYLNGELLTEAVIPEGVTAVNANVFAGCNSIVSVTLPKGLTKIGNQAFYRCNKLVEVRNYSSLSVSKGASDNGGVALYALNVTSGNESILAADGDFIFCDREDILLGYTGDETALTLPSSRNGKNYSVYKYAFYKNRTLTSLSASGGASSIGDYAFSYCPALSSVSLGKDVTEIGDCSFSYCRALTDISIGKNVTEIGNSAFYFCDPVALSLGESVRSIGEYAFAECRRLTDLTLGAALSSVDKNAFYNCNDIFAVRINDLSAYCKIDGLSNIRHEKSPSFSRLYLNGKALTHLVVPSDVTEIPDCAFKNCIDLLCVTLHENVTKIGNNAFFGCNKLLEVFNFSPLYIYAGSSNNGFVAYNARAVYTSASDVGKLKEQNDFVFYDDGAVSLVCYSGQNETLSLPDSFNGRNYSVYKYAFAGNPFVTEIRAGAGVESIGDGAFSACTALTKV